MNCFPKTTKQIPKKNHSDKVVTLTSMGDNNTLHYNTINKSAVGLITAG